MLAATRERARARLAAARALPAWSAAHAAAAAGLRVRRHRRAAVRAGAFDLVWSNLALQWVNDLPRAFAEFRRVLKVGGLASFTTFGPDTLKELRAAFAGADRHTHVSRFVDMHDIGDLLVHAGFADPVMDMEYMTLTYADGEALMRDLQRDRRDQRDASGGRAG